MGLPKVKFNLISLEENINIIKWAYFENESGDLLGVHNSVVEYFPELKYIDMNLTLNEVNDIIEDVVSDYYDKNKNYMKCEVKRYSTIWDKYNDVYFDALSKYLFIKWPDKMGFINVNVGLMPIFPRDLDSFGFSLSINLDTENFIRVVAHETLHFLWFEKWKVLYPYSLRREYDSPYLVWQYSEMVTDPILNSNVINRVLGINEKSYNCFYEIKDENNYIMDELCKIYDSDLEIDKKISCGFEYVKNILSDK